MPSDNDINKLLQKVFDAKYSEYERGVYDFELELLKAYKKAYDEIDSEIAKLYAAIGEPNINEARKFNRLVNLEKSIAEKIKTITKQSSLNIGNLLPASFEFGYYMTGFALENVSGVKLGFTLLNPSTIKTAVENDYALIKWKDSLINDANKAIQTVRQEISSGLAQGKPYKFISDKIRERIYGSDKDLKGLAYSTDRIVRTEAHRAHSGGRVAGIDKATQSAGRLGIDVKKVWRCVLDNLTREAHARADGQIADEEGLFHVGGETMDAPGRGTIAANNINCRCDAIVKVEGLPEGGRRDNLTGDLLDPTTFDDWAESKNIKMKYWKR